MTANRVLPPERVVSFIEETETAILLLDEGMRIIQAHNGGFDRRIVALHLTAQGFERFLKLTRAQALLTRGGELPSARQARQWGHRLLPLLDATVDELERDQSFSTRPAVRADLDFLRSDTRFRDLFAVLDEFATGGRYHNLDVMLDGRSAARSPLDRWNDYEMDRLREDAQWIRLMTTDPAGFGDTWYPHLAAIQIRILQRSARALARAWTLGPAQDLGRRLTGVIGRYLFLTDDELVRCPTRQQ